MFEGGQGCSAGATVRSRNQNYVRMSFRNARGYCAHSDFRYKFDVHPCLGISTLEVVDELGNILDGINIVVWRR